MKDISEFKKKQKVKIILDGKNASDFNRGKCNVLGVYQFDDWRKMIFEIGGKYFPIKFRHSKKIYGAYPIFYSGKLVGHVYNDAIKSVFNHP